MKKKIKYFKAPSVIISSMLLSLICSSCEKELDFEYHDIDPVLVIEGSLAADGAKVSLSYTTLMNQPMNNDKLTDATVKITDLSEGNIEELTVDDAGVFRSAMCGITGHDYRLDVVAGDKTYSSATRMQPPVEMKDLQFFWVKMPGDDMALIRILFTDNPHTNDYYWIRLYRNGDPYSMSVITDRAQVDGTIEETITTSHRDESQENDKKQLLQDGDLLTATVTPVNKTMFDFLVALQNNSNGAPQFSPDFCLGYFLASPVASASIVYRPDEIDYAR